MAKQPLALKQNKDKKEVAKKAKFKRKKDVFGKRLTRIGIFVLIVIELLAFAGVKIFFTINQKNKQEKIDAEIVKLKKDIKKKMDDSKLKAEEVDDIGKLLPSLPTAFDRKATNLDIDRMIALCSLKEKSTSARSYSTNAVIPFVTTSSTLKAVKITFTVEGKADEIDSVLTLVNYLTDYKHEYFYYINSINYREIRSGSSSSECNFEIYTFYNDVVLA